MKILNLRLDKENNLHTSLAGLLYMIENEYLNDSATIIRQTKEGKEYFTYFNDEEGIDLYPVDFYNENSQVGYDDEYIFCLSEENITAHYIIEKDGYLPEFIKDASIESNWIDPPETDMENVLAELFDDYGYDDVQFTIIYDDDGDVSSEENVGDLMDFLNDLFSLEEEEPKRKPKTQTIRDKAEENIVKRLNDKEYTKKEIDILKEMEYGEYAGTTELEDILSAVKRVLR